MSEPATHVFIDVAGSARIVGRLWAHRDRAGERASFEFDPAWLADPLHYALGPALPAAAGAFHTARGRALFGALGDSAPDRWGRRLITRNEARRARTEGKTPRAPREIDFLLGVTDFVRQGAQPVDPRQRYERHRGFRPLPTHATLRTALAGRRMGPPPTSANSHR